ncbi:MAG: SIR2 family NAD-dependent protein deacylase [Verrucomicrobiales bacterium]
MKEEIEKVRALLAGSECPLFITGAGVSAGAGLPTYRGIGGLYEGKDTEDGMPIEVALSGGMLCDRPDVTWKYLWEIAEVCRGAAPGSSHQVIAEIARTKPHTWVLTQNVDGLHAVSGVANLIEIHGRAAGLVCTGCGGEFDGGELLFSESCQPPAPPTCPDCGEILRPTVVLFGEQLPESELKKYDGLMTAGIDLVLSVGTSSLFPYIKMPVAFAAESGVPSVEINTGRTDISGLVTHRLEMECDEALLELWGDG